MFLEWWMIAVMFAWWLVSVWDISRDVFDEGATAAVQGLIENGYIDLDDNNEVIGLCNSHKLRAKSPSEDVSS